MSYEMTTGVRFCLYGPSKWQFIAFRANIIPISKRTVVKDVVNDVTYTGRSRSDAICVGHTILSTELQRRHMVRKVTPQ